jgi:hypothetical protein
LDIPPTGKWQKNIKVDNGGEGEGEGGCVLDQFVAASGKLEPIQDKNSMEAIKGQKLADIPSIDPQKIFLQFWYPLIFPLSSIGGIHLISIIANFVFVPFVNLSSSLPHLPSSSVFTISFPSSFTHFLLP